MRCDYDGVYENGSGGPMKWFRRRPSTYLVPGGCAGIAGGSMQMDITARVLRRPMSFRQTVTINPRIDGPHQFFLFVNSAHEKAELHIQQKDRPDTATKVVSVSEYAWDMGTIVLREGTLYTLTLIHAADLPETQAGGVRMQWEDSLLDTPDYDLTPIMV